MDNIGIFYTAAREVERLAVDGQRVGEVLVGLRFDKLIVRCVTSDFLDAEFVRWLIYVSCRRSSFVRGGVSPYVIEVA